MGSLCWPFAPWLSPKKRLFKLKSRPSSHMVLTPTLSVTDTELCLTPVCPTPLALFFLMLPTPLTPTPALTLSPPLPTTTTSWTPPRNHRLTCPVLTPTSTKSLEMIDQINQETSKQTNKNSKLSLNMKCKNYWNETKKTFTSPTKKKNFFSPQKKKKKKKKKK